VATGPLRVLLHVAALVAPAIPPGVVVGSQIACGWRPTSDDAAIAWRTWDVFSAHAPLVGAFNDATRSTAQPIFDLGPMQYYLLALPERIDPVHGILWGAAIVVAVFAGLSVESAWRAFGPGGAVLVSGGFVMITATQVVALLNLPWNPDLGLYAFASAIVLAIVAGTGRTAWWPVGVGTGCVAAQCHLVFAVPAAAALAVGGALGLLARACAATRPPRSLLRAAAHLGAGVAVALLEMAAPLVQQVADRPGNLSALAHNLSHQGPSRGLSSGFAALARAAGVWPIWTHPVPPVGTLARDLRFFGAVLDGSSTLGIALAVAVGVVGLLALVTRRTTLAATALVTLASSLGLAWTLGAVAQRQTAVLTYTDVALWPVGMAIDLVLVWGAIEVIRAFVFSAADWQSRGVGRTDQLRPAVALLGIAGLAAGVVWGVTSLVASTPHSDAVIGGWGVSRAVDPVSATIRRQVRHGERFVVEPSVALFANGLPTWALVEGVLYQLHSGGYRASILPPMAPELGGDAAAPTRPQAVFEIVPTAPGRWRVVRVRHVKPMEMLAWLTPR
jgi:hypothetical protein